MSSTIPAAAPAPAVAPAPAPAPAAAPPTMAEGLDRRLPETVSALFRLGDDLADAGEQDWANRLDVILDFLLGSNRNQYFLYKVWQAARP